MDWREASMGAGINPGWEPLVDELHAKLLEIDPDLVVHQVKEKFGGLRYYFDSSKPELLIKLTSIVDDYEFMSIATCEVCGRPGQNGNWNHNWVNTLCATHGQRRERTGIPVWKMALDSDELDHGDEDMVE